MTSKRHICQQDSGLKACYVKLLRVIWQLSGYPTLTSLYKILVSLAVTSCSAERVMSRIHIVDDWFASLTVLACERDTITKTGRNCWSLGYALCCSEEVHNYCNISTYVSRPTAWQLWRYAFLCLCTSLQILFFTVHQSSGAVVGGGQSDDTRGECFIGLRGDGRPWIYMRLFVLKQGNRYTDR